MCIRAVGEREYNQTLDLNLLRHPASLSPFHLTPTPTKQSEVEDDSDDDFVSLKMLKRPRPPSSSSSSPSTLSQRKVAAGGNKPKAVRRITPQQGEAFKGVLEEWRLQQATKFNTRYFYILPETEASCVG